MIEIYLTSYFKKAFRKLPKNIKEKVEEKEKIFKINPFDVVLNMHKLHGKYKNYWSFSVDNSYRVMFQFLNATKTKAAFIIIGTHEIYK